MPDPIKGIGQPWVKELHYSTISWSSKSSICEFPRGNSELARWPNNRLKISSPKSKHVACPRPPYLLQRSDCKPVAALDLCQISVKFVQNFTKIIYRQFQQLKFRVQIFRSAKSKGFGRSMEELRTTTPIAFVQGQLLP